MPDVTFTVSLDEARLIAMALEQCSWHLRASYRSLTRPMGDSLISPRTMALDQQITDVEMLC